jgi:hypothetical protein
MITDYKKRTAQRKKKFEKEISLFIGILKSQTPKILRITKMDLVISKEHGLLRTFELENKNPGKHAHKITIAINASGYVHCIYFWENKNPWDGAVEYTEVNNYELEKSSLKDFLPKITRWQKAKTFVNCYKYCTEWVLAGN